MEKKTRGWVARGIVLHFIRITFKATKLLTYLGNGLDVLGVARGHDESLHLAWAGLVVEEVAKGVAVPQLDRRPAVGKERAELGNVGLDREVRVEPHRQRGNTKNPYATWPFH